MLDKLYYITLSYNGCEKLRLWITEAELIRFLLELKSNNYDFILFNRGIELKIMKECNGDLTTFYYDNINNIELDEVISKSTHKEFAIGQS